MRIDFGRLALSFILSVCLSVFLPLSLFTYFLFPFCAEDQAQGLVY